jgi:hypothetical protein
MHRFTFSFSKVAGVALGAMATVTSVFAAAACSSAPSEAGTETNSSAIVTPNTVFRCQSENECDWPPSVSACTATPGCEATPDMVCGASTNPSDPDAGYVPGDCPQSPDTTQQTCTATPGCRWFGVYNCAQSTPCPPTTRTAEECTAANPQCTATPVCIPLTCDDVGCTNGWIPNGCGGRIRCLCGPPPGSGGPGAIQ